MSKKLPISIEDVREAASVLDGQIERTPMRHSRTLSEITGNPSRWSASATHVSSNRGASFAPCRA
ncbi:MAG: hypothetical protein VXW22_13705, partial [Pseudomonadota bacterium]|nr:hypothetical protein [Pseudomonadota bacterium]